MTCVKEHHPAVVVRAGFDMPRQRVTRSAESSQECLGLVKVVVPSGQTGSDHRSRVMCHADMWLDDRQVAGNDGQRIRRQSVEHDASTC